MDMRAFPTSSDIYIEVDGTRVAVVQGYTAKAVKKNSASIEAFGEREPVATVAGQIQHELKLTRLYATEAAVMDGIDFYQMEDFSLVICKPDRKIIYGGCQWKEISEVGALGAMVVESISVLASQRIEMEA